MADEPTPCEQAAARAQVIGTAVGVVIGAALCFVVVKYVLR
jgi:large-conductance mechanosensitive channel